jgi:hypothetical protein
MFLVPWMLIYGASAFCLNHNRWFIEHFDVKPPQWAVVREVDFVPPDGFPTVPEDQAKAILQDLDLEGAHRIQGKPNPSQMTIFRVCGSGHYRITWRPHRSMLVVEKQSFSFYRLLHFLHFRAGYGQPYLVHLIWAVVVDVVGISILVWVISGVYIWARSPKRRLEGGICLIAGSLLFMNLVIMLCH